MKNFWEKNRKVLLVLFVSLMVVWSGWQVTKWGLKGLYRAGLVPDEAAHAVSFLVNLNELEVIAKDGIERDQIEIFWNGEQVFAEGKVLKGNFNKRQVRYKYGPQSFGIKYQGRELSKSESVKFVQYKTDNWSFSKYSVEVFQGKDGKVAAYFSEGGSSNIKFIEN
jgi:hypothetical protein